MSSASTIFELAMSYKMQEQSLLFQFRLNLRRETAISILSSDKKKFSKRILRIYPRGKAGKKLREELSYLYVTQPTDKENNDEMGR